MLIETFVHSDAFGSTAVYVILERVWYIALCFLGSVRYPIGFVNNHTHIETFKPNNWLFNTLYSGNWYLQNGNI